MDSHAFTADVSQFMELRQNRQLALFKAICQKLGAALIASKQSEASPIGQSGANIFKNYSV